MDESDSIVTIDIGHYSSGDLGAERSVELNNTRDGDEMRFVLVFYNRI